MVQVVRMVATTIGSHDELGVEEVTTRRAVSLISRVFVYEVSFETAFIKLVWSAHNLKAKTRKRRVP